MSYRPSIRPVVPAVVAGATVTLSATTVLMVVVQHQSAMRLVTGQEANTWQAGLVFGIIGAAVLRDSPSNRLGAVIAVAAGCASVASLAQEYAPFSLQRGLVLSGVAVWLAAILWLPGFLGLAAVVPQLFPDGRLPSPRWRWPARIGCGALAVGFVTFATTQEAIDGNGIGHLRNPFDLPLADGPQLFAAAGLLAIGTGIGVASIVRVLAHLRKASPEERPRYAWFAAAVLLGFTQLLPISPVVTSPLGIASFAALGIGILRHRMFEIEPVLPRALVYLLLIGASLAIYLAAATILGTEVNGAARGITAALATACGALLLARLQSSLVDAVTRLLYGERDDPAQALTRLGDRLAAALGTDEVLPSCVAAVRRTLRVPYAAISLTGEAAPVTQAGRTPALTVGLPLVHAGQEVRHLRIGLRAGERTCPVETLTY